MYKKENIEDIDWIDITDNKEAEKETSKNDKELLRRLHIKENDKVIEGAEAFLYVWKKIPKYKFLSKILSIKPLFFIFHYLYEVAAYFLFLKNRKQLKWRNKIYQLRFVKFVIVLLLGEKNGNLTGTK